jgi:cation diffusion facilitator CzcD-associated flavoprotein CzcO
MPSIRKDIGRAPIGGAIDGANGTLEGAEDLDVLVIGAGFSGCRLLYELRRRGFKVKLVEAGSDLGGIWHWNTYPGARVDSQYPVYALSIPEVYETWSWTEQYPGYEELQRYFTHVGNVLDLKKDCIFNTKVTAADWDKSANRWTVHCDHGKTFKTWAMIAAIGFAAKRHFPDWPGLDTFGGTSHHSSFWPRDVDYAGKKVAVIGTGATGTTPPWNKRSNADW